MDRTHKEWRPCACDPVIIRDSMILLGKRAEEPFVGYWVLPGGMVEQGESVREACVREAKEETNLDVKIISFLGLFDRPDRDPAKGSVSAAFLCVPLSGEVRRNEEASDMRWFPLDRLPERIGFDHREVIEKAKETMKTLDFSGREPEPEQPDR